MREDTRLHVSTAMSGLAYSLRLIEKALHGEKRSGPARSGPFALALMRVAEIADGAPVVSIELARADMLYCFEMLHYLRGGFWGSAFGILKRAHDLVADRINEKEAAAILDVPVLMLAIEERMGNLHSLDLAYGMWAKYEVEALKARWDFAMHGPLEIGSIAPGKAEAKEPGADG